MKPAWQWIARELRHAIDNPRTTGMGVATMFSSLALHGVAEKVTAVFTGLGILLSKDGNQGGTLPPPEVDSAVKKVEQKL